ncbi:MAG TPA: FAD-dependent oxidoreductase [Candidatus Kapabacteria bacterium]|nr:FAD-dependent oxidoreductase [Candidatus Kapabacteria bacterium]
MEALRRCDRMEGPLRRMDAASAAGVLFMNKPYWTSTASVPRFPAIGNDLTVDVVIVGGGITGITAASLLKRAGATFALLERGSLASADTGSTTAHLTCVTDVRLHELVRKFGRDHALAVWDAGQAAIEQIREFIGEETIDCDFSHVPGFLHQSLESHTEDESKRLQEDAAIAAELGIGAAYVSKAPLVNLPAVRFPNQAKFNPRKYLSALVEVTSGEGCHFFENSDVASITDDPLQVTSHGCKIRCGHVLIATHVPLQGITSTLSAALFQTKLTAYTSYAVGAKIPGGVYPEACFWDTNNPYNYVRIDRGVENDYAIFGGEDHKTGQELEASKRFAQLREKMISLLPDATFDREWSGQVIETADGLPYIGEVASGQFIATGFAGNGMTFGTLAAMMFCDELSGRSNPWKTLFDVNRKAFPSGAWDYLKENKDFPYYFLKDRLAKTRSKSTEEIKPGEGCIVDLGGTRVAAYRDENGKLSAKSAVCPHLGCLVRWNEAEHTWDCPCHGSRFKPTGEVMAGPAESGLQNA